MKCHKCEGTGRTIKETNPRLRDSICPHCNGTGKQTEEEVVSQKEINHDANREKELQLLCKSVLSLCTEQIYDSNGFDSCYCPLCDVEEDGRLNMNEIKHNRDCGWLIAKGLSTRTGES